MAVFAGLLVVLLFTLSIAVTLVVLFFAVINGLALFGPDGDVTSVWHWVWFVFCVLLLLGGVFSRASR